jgi:hypothetical protein
MTKQTVDNIPIWAGDQQCKPRAGTIMFDSYNTVPSGLPAKLVTNNYIPNSCSQICLPTGVKGAAEGHGVHYGSSCFGENDSTLNPFGGNGNAIPAHTAICPGFTFHEEGAVAGVQYFIYTCEDGDVIDYGAPYK